LTRAIAIALALALTHCALAHPDSLSTSVVRVDGAQASVTLRCQILSLVEVIDGLDADSDGIVEAPEVDAKQSEIARYINDHFALFTRTNRDLSGGQRLIATVERITHAEPGIRDGLRYREGSVDIELACAATVEIQDLIVEATLFHTTSPDHIDLTRIEWPDGVVEHGATYIDVPRTRFDRAGRGAFGAFLMMGWRHILGGWDHLAFVGVLVLAARRLGSVLGVVTAFTVAHSVTLAISVLGLINLADHRGLVEAAIALSIAYVACDSLLHPNPKLGRAPEAFVFGLLHGLGFAGFVSQSLVHEPARWLALLSFNLGVEVGQVVVVILLTLALLLVRWLSRKPQGDDDHIALRPIRVTGCVVSAILGFFWFFERI
jgi:hypothetical protein